MNVWCEEKRKGFRLFPLETDEHSFPVNLIGYMLKKELLYTVHWTQSLIFSLLKWMVCSSEPLSQQTLNILFVRWMYLFRSSVCRHWVHFRGQMSIQNAYRHPVWFGTNGRGDLSLQRGKPAKFNLFWCSSSDCGPWWSSLDAPDQLTVEQLKKGIEKECVLRQQH